MIEATLDKEHSLLILRPKSAIEQDDFVKVAQLADPYIEETGGLAGLIIEVTAFPGWKNIGAMANHFRFMRDHHERIEKIAVVTDSVMGDVAEQLASHFVAAEIKHFQAGEEELAKQWVESNRGENPLGS